MYKCYVYQYLGPNQIVMEHYLALLLMQIAWLITPGCLGESGSIASLELENLNDLEARSGKETKIPLVHLILMHI